MPHAPMPSADVEPDLARPYSQHRVTGQAGLAPCRGSCAHPAGGLLTLPCHSWPDGKMSSACSARSASSAHSAHSASSAAQPGWQPGPSAMAPQQAGHHAHARQGSRGILLPMGDTAPGGARKGQPGLLLSPALPHGSVVPSAPQLSHFWGTWGFNAMPMLGTAQCTCLCGQAALPPRSWLWGCLPGTGPQLSARAPSPTMHLLEYPGLTPATLLPTAGQLWQSRQTGQAAPSPQSSAQPRAHPVLPVTAMGLSQW